MNLLDKRNTYYILDLMYLIYYMDYIPDITLIIQTSLVSTELSDNVFDRHI